MDERIALARQILDLVVKSGVDKWQAYDALFIANTLLASAFAEVKTHGTPEA